jgi:hypothetical protein
MKRLAALLLLALTGCSACTKVLPDILPAVPLEVDPSIAIFTPDGGGGHACPVEGQVITARHVMWSEQHKTFLMGSWSSQGARGGAEVSGAALALDLVRLTLYGGTVPYLSLGESPKPDDKVYWFEYDFRTASNAYRARRRAGKVLRAVAGHLILDSNPVGGASGSCLLDAQGNVVGIVIATMDTDDGGAVGVAIELTRDMVAQ